MGFNVRCKLSGCEYRGIRTGIGNRTGKRWMTLVVEDDTARQIDVSVPDDMQQAIESMALVKGDALDLVVDCVAGGRGDKAYSFINLVNIPYADNKKVVES